jgi:NAD(P)-dependent dehydrogenase (short-subunit alcohol dehydrogenase family)
VCRARLLVSGSSTGLALMSAALLASQGHHVVPHSRNNERAEEAGDALLHAEAVVQGDVSTTAGARHVADKVNRRRV